MCRPLVDGEGTISYYLLIYEHFTCTNIHLSFNNYWREKLQCMISHGHFPKCSATTFADIGLISGVEYSYLFVFCMPFAD